MINNLIYKIVPRDLWAAAEQAGIFAGAPVDIKDGYIHFSTADQVHETAAKHFAGQSNLLLISIDADRLGDKLQYETSRGGALFPHLYAPLSFDAVVKIEALPLGEDGVHCFPELGDKK